MNYDEFARIVSGMRLAQKRYFRERKEADLKEAKRLEREVDALLRTGPKQPTLFEVGEYGD